MTRAGACRHHCFIGVCQLRGHKVNPKVQNPDPRHSDPSQVAFRPNRPRGLRIRCLFRRQTKRPWPIDHPSTPNPTPLCAIAAATAAFLRARRSPAARAARAAWVNEDAHLSHVFPFLLALSLPTHTPRGQEEDHRRRRRLLPSQLPPRLPPLSEGSSLTLLRPQLVLLCEAVVPGVGEWYGSGGGSVGM